jgi:hypothetical protein
MVHRRADGTLVVWDAVDLRIKLISATGDLLRTAGRSGHGPGEFSGGQYSAVPLAGEGIAVVDQNSGTVSVFDSGLRFVRTMRPARPRGWRFYSPLVVFPDTSFLAYQEEPSTDACTEGVETVSVPWERIGEHRRTSFGTLFFRRNRVFQLPPHGCGRATDYEPYAVFASRGENLYYTPGDRFEVSIFDSAGQAGQLWRLEKRPPSAKSVIKPGETVHAAEMPRWLPAIEHLVVDGHGNLWAAELRLSPTDPQRWVTFDTAGHYQGSVVVAPNFSPIEIGGDYLLGIAVLEDGTSHIQSYSFESLR